MERFFKIANVAMDVLVFTMVMMIIAYEFWPE